MKYTWDNITVYLLDIEDTEKQSAALSKYFFVTSKV